MSNTKKVEDLEPGDQVVMSGLPFKVISTIYSFYFGKHWITFQGENHREGYLMDGSCEINMAKGVKQ